MKPVPAIISENDIKKPVFMIREINQSFFDNKFHFHEECQLAYIIKGNGKRIIGDSVEYFEENELIFLGSGLPHIWFNANSKKESKKKNKSISRSLFISPNKFTEHFSAFGEIQKVEQLFQKAQRGMFITGQTKKKMIDMLLKISSNHGIADIIILLQILQILISTHEYHLLAGSNYVNNFQNRDNERMDKVYQYLLKNFKEEITLQQVATVASMNPNAFCRYFKSHTQKSCTRFINELRISYACKLLAYKNESITQIAYECGFNNVSNFNRCFKMIKKSNPGKYRKDLEMM